MDARKSFHQEIDDLKKDILKMGLMVEEAIFHAVKSLAGLDATIAQQVITGDEAINEMMVEIESHALRLLALQQPMAVDLRVIGTALKIVTDLERIGDHAVDIAKTTMRLQGEKLLKPLVDTPRMADLAKDMLRQSLDSYVKRDLNLAQDLAVRDDAVDKIYKEIFNELEELMVADKNNVKQAVKLLMVANSLERIADHATNIGEWVIYMVSGKRKELNH